MMFVGKLQKTSKTTIRKRRRTFQLFTNLGELT